MISVATIIEQLFKIEKQNEINILLKWLGLENMNEICLPNVENRLKFLCTIWKNPIFRAFDTKVTAENYLNMDRKYGFIIRLSSEPGKISVSNKLRGVDHRRFTITEQGKIIDSKGNSYDNIDQLASHVAKILSKYSRRCEPVPKY